MIEHRCKDCIWWDSQHPAVKLLVPQFGKMVLGFCRKHKPVGLQVDRVLYGAQPVMDANEFCGEFRAEAV